MIEYVSAFLSTHPQLVTAVVGAVFVHLRAIVPAGKTGTFWGIFTDVWDAAAGNWGNAKNAPVQDKQDGPKVGNALDV